MATLAAPARRASPPAEPAHGLALTYHRLMLVMLLFVGVTAIIVLRLGYLQLFSDRSAAAELGNPLLPPRGDIVDRNGVPLARTIDAWTIGVQPRAIIGDRRELAQRLHVLMPERSVAQYRRLLGADVGFTYIARRAVPEMVAAVNALGEPGLVFSREPERLYPQTAMAGHVLGWTDREGHGVAGMERVLEDRLIDPAQRGEPVALSIDSRVQAMMEAELATAVTAMQAEGGTGIVLDVRTGEVVAMASAPTFNPNAASRSDDNALYNRATMGVYELGSTFKPITIAAAMEAGVVTSLHQRWDASSPVAVGRFRISDDHPLGRCISVAELMVHSSNIATARVADQMGPERMQAAFRALGFDEPAHIELNERTRPLLAARLGPGDGADLGLRPRRRDHSAPPRQRLCGPGQWRHLAAGDPDAGRARPGGARAGGSIRRRPASGCGNCSGSSSPTAPAGAPKRPASASAARPARPRKPARAAIRTESNVSTFAAAFPMDDPRYVVLVMVDAPRPTEANSFVTTAAYTAAPIVSRVIARTGPLLGIIPDDSRDIDTSDLMPPADPPGH